MTQSVEIKGSPATALLEGRLFSASVEEEDSAGVDILFRTAADSSPTVALRAGVELACTLELFEAPTSSADGAAVPRINHNRKGTPTVATSLVFDGPTVSATGVSLGQHYIAAGSGGNAPGGDAESAFPFILAPDTDYLLRLLPITGTPDVDLGIAWIE